MTLNGSLLYEEEEGEGGGRRRRERGQAWRGRVLLSRRLEDTRIRPKTRK